MGITAGASARWGKVDVDRCVDIALVDHRMVADMAVRDVELRRQHHLDRQAESCAVCFREKWFSRLDLGSLLGSWPPKSEAEPRTSITTR